MISSRDELLNQLQSICSICQAVLLHRHCSDEKIIAFLDNFDRKTSIYTILHALACDYFATTKATNYFINRAQKAFEEAIYQFQIPQVQTDFKCIQDYYHRIRQTQNYFKMNIHQFLEKVVKRHEFPPTMLPTLEMCQTAIQELRTAIFLLDGDLYYLASELLKKISTLPKEAWNNVEMLATSIDKEARCLFEALCKEDDFSELHHLIYRFSLLTTHANEHQNEVKCPDNFWLVHDILEIEHVENFLRHRYEKLHPPEDALAELPAPPPSEEDIMLEESDLMIESFPEEETKMEETSSMLENPTPLLLPTTRFISPPNDGFAAPAEITPPRARKRQREEAELAQTLPPEPFDLTATIDIFAAHLQEKDNNPEKPTESSSTRPVKRGRWGQT